MFFQLFASSPKSFFILTEKFKFKKTIILLIAIVSQSHILQALKRSILYSERFQMTEDYSVTRILKGNLSRLFFY
jgi:hypothetical protein